MMAGPLDGRVGHPRNRAALAIMARWMGFAGLPHTGVAVTREPDE
jgi:hypothetical protein